ncbi:MAG: NUDIX hydrolase [Sphingobacteriales bacterium]|jgi:ADP-ribose pyrophosphatase YjhB (NUDIX family)|nr:MAG: NUDIX hydrolase [Sphingobacteriales bacterium]
MFPKQNFCSNCGEKVVYQQAEGRERCVCLSCNIIHYTNPKVIVGALAYWEDKVLLCRRAIEPRKGFWNIPAGFLEDDEKTEDGAIREVWEEAGTNIEIIQPYLIYNLPQANQVYIHFLAKLTDGIVRNGEESIESKLLTEEEIPWNEIAFYSSSYALKRFFEERKNSRFTMHLASFPEK